MKIMSELKESRNLREIDITPTWADIMPGMIHVLTQPKPDAEDLTIVKESLMKCAKVADLYVESVKGAGDIREAFQLLEEARKSSFWDSEEPNLTRRVIAIELRCKLLEAADILAQITADLYVKSVKEA